MELLFPKKSPVRVAQTAATRTLGVLSVPSVHSVSKAVQCMSNRDARERRTLRAPHLSIQGSSATAFRRIDRGFENSQHVSAEDFGDVGVGVAAIEEGLRDTRKHGDVFHAGG